MRDHRLSTNLLKGSSRSGFGSQTTPPPPLRSPNRKNPTHLPTMASTTAKTTTTADPITLDLNAHTEICFESIKDALNSNNLVLATTGIKRNGNPVFRAMTKFEKKGVQNTNPWDVGAPLDGYTLEQVDPTEFVQERAAYQLTMASATDVLVPPRLASTTSR